MRRLKLGLTIAGIMSPTLSYALGLGEITTNSTLNQTLDADIELISAAAGEINDVKVRIAPDEVFRQVGIARSPVVDQLTFKPTIINGVPVIKVSSRGAIQEPFLNFVIEVVWSKGKLLREYTVLLDPPILATGDSSPAPAAAPVVATPTVRQEPPAVAPTPRAAAPEPAVTARAPAVEPEGLPPFVTGAPSAAPPAIAESRPAPEPRRPARAPAQTTPAPEAGGSFQGPGYSVPLAQTYSVEDLVAPKGKQRATRQPEPPATRAAREPQGAQEVPLSAVAQGDGLRPIDPVLGTDQIFTGVPKETFPVAGLERERTGAGAGETYRVKRGDTLYNIANNTRPADVGVKQMMVGIYRENPRAFVDGNMNRLKSGYVMRLPDEADLAKVTPRIANREIAKATGAWRQYRTKLAEAPVPQTQIAGAADRKASGKGAPDTKVATAPEAAEPKSALEIIVPESKGEGAKAAQVADAGKASSTAAALAREKTESLQRENEELRSRVAELEALVAAKDRLIQLKDSQLVDLQKQLGKGAVELAKPTESATAAPPAEPGKGLLPSLEERAAPGEGGKVAESKPASELKPVEPPAEVVKPTPPAKPVKAAEGAPAEGSLIDNLKRDPNMLMGAGLAGLMLAALAWLVFRRRPEPEEEFDDTRVQTVITEREGGVAPAPDLRETVVDSDYEEDSTLHRESEVERTVQMSREDLTEKLSEEAVSGGLAAEAGEDVDDDEVLSEANIYMAYGLHDQALDVLKPAVEANPHRIDYQVKLAEVYHALRDKANFLSVASGLHGQLESRDPDAWHKLGGLARDLDIKDPMFEGVELGTSTAEMDVQPATPDYDLSAETASWSKDATQHEINTVSLEGIDFGKEEYEEERNPAGEFRLPDLDELSRSLQIERDEALSALSVRDDEDEDGVIDRGNLESRPRTLSPDDHLTLADVEEEFTVLTTGSDEMNTKLDLAKAYIDMGDDEGAREALEEVMAQGTDEQRQEASKLMAQLG